jgi:drug/metabolite transporter (DMT)-like permease
LNFKLMLYLLLTVLLNVIISAILKIFPRYKIDALQAIVANYWVCVITGSVFVGQFPINMQNTQQIWFPWSLLMGLGFISIFNLLAYSTKVDGITTTTIANKLSLAIPVIFSVILYNESIGVWKILGILLAFPAVYLTSRVKGEDNKAQNLFIAVILFISSGLLDTLVKFVEIHFLPSVNVQAIYLIYAFAAAGSIGLIVITILLVMKKIELHARNVIIGIILGVPNYFSIYFLVRLLNSNYLQSSAAIPVNNVAILVVTTLMAILFFKERFTVQRFIGLVLSVLAILLIAMGDMHGRSI